MRQIIAAAVIMSIAAVILMEIPAPQWREGYYIVEGNITVTVLPDRVEPLPGKTCYLAAPHLDAPVLFYAPVEWGVYIGQYRLDKTYITVRGLGYAGQVSPCGGDYRPFGVPTAVTYHINLGEVYPDYTYVVFGATCDSPYCVYISAYWPDYNRYTPSIACRITGALCMTYGVTIYVTAARVADRVYVYVAHPNITITEPLTFVNCRLYYSEWKAALLDKSIGTWWTR